MSERFSLKWNDFQSVVSQSFSVLRREEDFYDVTLVSDDHTQISAHKLVLSASSHFFKSILKRNPHSHPLLYLSGVDGKSLGLVLDYIYQGEVQITHQELEPFLDVAQKLKIEGLLTTTELRIQQQKQQQQKKATKLQELKKEPMNRQENPKVANLKNEILYIPVTDSDVLAFKEEPNKTIKPEKPMVVHTRAEVELQIQQLMERREKHYYCRVCNYFSNHSGHVKEHVEKHIEGLSYSCQLCSKTFR